VLREIDFLFQKFAAGFNSVTFVETSYLNTDMWEFESSQTEKVEPSRLIPRKLAANLELLNVIFFLVNVP